MRELIYQFSIGEIEVRAFVYPEDSDPSDVFDCEETVEQIRNGLIDWFGVTVEVLKNGHVIGSDHLGGCAYNTVHQFFDEHRDPDPMNRNCSIMRAARGGNAAVCHYFPSMISQATADARQTLGH